MGLPLFKEEVELLKVANKISQNNATKYINGSSISFTHLATEYYNRYREIDCRVYPQFVRHFHGQSAAIWLGKG